MLTRSGWAVLVGSALTFGAGRLLGVVELFVLASVAVALLALAIVWVRLPAGPLAVSRRVSPPRVAVGGAGRVELAVTNRGPRNLPPVLLRDPVEGTIGARLTVGPVGPNRGVEVGYRLPTTRRGPLRVGPLFVELTDPFGLARRRLPGADELVITILPAIDPAPPLPVGGGRHEPLAGLSHRMVTTSGAEDLVTLRPYVVGDDLRRVHWPSSAHTDELQVRRDEERWQGHLTVVLDARTGVLSPNAFERAISAAAGIVSAVAESGDRVRLIITGATDAGHLDTGMVDAARAAGSVMEDLALAHQHANAAPLPPADPRLANTVLLLTGANPGPLVDDLTASGYREAVLIRFVDDPAAGRTSDQRTTESITVIGSEGLAAAWDRRNRRTGVGGRS